MKAGQTTRNPKEKFRSLCRRWTARREEILSLLIKCQRQPMTAKEIFVSLQPEGHDLGMATVYRTLELLDKAGLVVKVRYPGGQLRYQYSHGDPSERRFHLICTVCGKTLTFKEFEKEETALALRTEEQLEQKSGFLIKEHNFEYFGLCKKCRPDKGKFHSTQSRAAESGKRIDTTGGTPRKEIS